MKQAKSCKSATFNNRYLAHTSIQIKNKAFNINRQYESVKAICGN